MSQENISYQLPPQNILQLANYQRAPGVLIDSKSRYMLLTYRDTYKSLSDLTQNEMSLAGLRINPQLNISSTISYIKNLKLWNLNQNKEIDINSLPVNMHVSYITWSPDETKVAFTNTTKNGVELWVIDLIIAEAKKLTKDNLNANLGNPFCWFTNSKELLIRIIPDNRTQLIDTRTNIPHGPSISISDGKKAQNRTYSDLLKNVDDEKNFITLTTSELHKVDLEGNMTLFREANMYFNESFSPDGSYLLVSTFEKPFSYIVPLNRFPHKTVVLSRSGTLVNEINSVPLSESLPKGFMAVRKGKREISWRSDVKSTLVFVEALDNGDPENQVSERDAIYLWEAPFRCEPELFFKTQQRFSQILWGNDKITIVQDEWYDTRNEKTYLINPGKKQEYTIINDRNVQDIYADPGSFEMRKNSFSKYVLTINDNSIYRIGEGYSPNGQFPFLDEFDTEKRSTKRLYQADDKNKMEEILDVLSVDDGDILVRIQSKSEYPNYYIRNINSNKSPKPLTFFPNPFKLLENVSKELIKYKRYDGIELSGTLYLPAGYDKNKKEKLPLLIWAYPTEYKDKNSAGQSTINANEFTFPYYGSFVYWATRGYAVLDDASFPIVGEGTVEPNDNFMEQLVANAKAAIDAIDSLGYINRSKVAIGGHSYGAFMTANLLTHSNLFACGIARSGAYNRTLTPFGFQTEQRNYWDIPDIYTSISPFMHADKMKTPILLVHGEADNNPGTFTLQTERYFQALKGFGAPARMVILPKESHGYMAKENILHLLWEQNEFLDKHLKN